MKTYLFILGLILSFSMMGQTMYYGAGSNATGGRGQTVVKVTNLNDSGPGSLRDAIGNNRYIIFSVSGTIRITSAITQDDISNITVDGFSAPQGGITIVGDLPNEPLWETSRWNNAIIKGLRFRKHHDPTGGDNGDSFQCGDCENLVFQNNSVSWAGDEGMGAPLESKNITWAYNIIGETSVGATAGRIRSSSAGPYSYLRNMYVNVSHRHPYGGASNQVDIINQVSHNWNGRAAISFANAATKHNYIGNYLQPARGRNIQTRNGNITNGVGNWIDVRDLWENWDIRIYSYNNFWPGLHETPNVIDYNPLWVQRFPLTLGPAAGTAQYADGHPHFRSDSMFPILGLPIPILDPQEAKEWAENNAGAHYFIDNNGILNNRDWDGPDSVWRDAVINNTAISYMHPIDPTDSDYYQDFLASVSSTPLNERPQ